MVALARMRRDLHLAQQRVHLGDRQHPPGADRAVAGHRRGDMVEPLLEAQRLVERGEFVGEIGDQPGDIALRRASPASRAPASRAGRSVRARARARPVRRRAPRAGRRPASSSSTTSGSSSACDATPPSGHRRAHPLEHQPLVRGMLVDEHQAVLGLGDDIGARDLPARDAEREVDRLGRPAASARLRRAPRWRRGEARRAGRTADSVARRRLTLPAPGLSRSECGSGEMRAAGSRARAATAPARGARAAATLRWPASSSARRRPLTIMPADQRRIAEAHFGLGRVDVHVDLVGRHVEEQRHHRMAVAREQSRHRRRAPRRRAAGPSPAGR